MSARSQSFAAELQNVLARRFATVSSLSFDTDGEPYLLIGAGTAGSQSAIVKVKTYAPLGVNVIGLAATAFAPLVTQIVLETSTIANVPLLIQSNVLALLGELGHRGARQELYMTANTVAVTVGAIIAGNLKATFDPDLQYKLMDSI